MKKKVSLILILAMIGTIFTGCGFIDSFTVVKAGDNSLSYGAANFYARYTQQQYEQYYGSQDSTGKFWSEKTGKEGTLEENTKDTIMETLKNMLVLENHMKDKKISLSSSEKKDIKKVAKKIVKANSKKARREFSITEKNVKRILTLITIQAKVHKSIVDATDTSDITDESALQKKMHYVKFEYDSNLTSANSTNDIKDAISDAQNSTESPKDDKDTAKSKADELVNKLKSKGVTSDNIETLVEENSYTAQAQNFGKDDTTPSDAVVKKAFEMKAGDLDVVEDTDAYYVVYIDSENDEEASANKKKELINSKQEEAYSKQLEEWSKKTNFSVRNILWNRIDFEKTGVK